MKKYADELSLGHVHGSGMFDTLFGHPIHMVRGTGYSNWVPCSGLVLKYARWNYREGKSEFGSAERAAADALKEAAHVYT